ncbi:MAG: DUF6242 domain-containing protein [Dysgonamonadaceae bacterium]|jgi:hypothetical protein|nr:DUF6242 domain-containing protein [Dysgonamonadaceae bacterium]
MHIKTVFYIFCCSILVLLASCLGNSDVDTIAVPNDSELLSLTLSHDSIPDLAKTVFSIDQRNNLIFNHDSLAYQTQVEKVIVKYTNSTGISNVLFLPTEGDSVWIASGDSLDVSKKVSLRVYAADGIKTKLYSLWVNVHQIDPDSVQYRNLLENQNFIKNTEVKTIACGGNYLLYTRDNSIVYIYQSDSIKNLSLMRHDGSIPNDLDLSSIQSCEHGVFAVNAAGDFYFSDNGLTGWQQKTAPLPIKVVLGFLKESSIQKTGYAFIVKKTVNGEQKNVFAFMDYSSGNWKEGAEVDEDFPLSGFSVINSEVMFSQQIALVGGVNALGEALDLVWTTQNGIHWAKLNDTEGRFPKMFGANAFLYDDEYYLLNGKLLDGSYNKKVYYSIDKGRTWKEKAEKYWAPSSYPLRQNASLVMDEKGANFYIVGGENSTILGDVWQAFLNKKTFAD